MTLQQLGYDKSSSKPQTNWDKMVDSSVFLNDGDSALTASLRGCLPAVCPAGGASLPLRVQTRSAPERDGGITVTVH